MLNAKIEKDFSYHAPINDQPEIYQDLREAAKDMAYEIESVCPDCDEKKTAFMKLNEVVFWANASIARYGYVKYENSEKFRADKLCAYSEEFRAEKLIDEFIEAQEKEQ